MYFTYNKAGEPLPTPPGGRKSAITLARGTFDGKALTDVKDLFVGDFQNGRERIASRLRARRPAVPDHRRAVR